MYRAACTKVWTCAAREAADAPPRAASTAPFASRLRASAHDTSDPTAVTGPGCPACTCYQARPSPPGLPMAHEGAPQQSLCGLALQCHASLVTPRHSHPLHSPPQGYTSYSPCRCRAKAYASQEDAGSAPACESRGTAGGSADARRHRRRIVRPTSGMAQLLATRKQEGGNERVRCTTGPPTGDPRLRLETTTGAYPYTSLPKTHDLFGPRTTTRPFQAITRTNPGPRGLRAAQLCY